MERIVLKHLSGSKANQRDDIPLAHFKELTIGRDPSNAIKYDPDRDDLVGRQHAKIVRDPVDPTQFSLIDLNSRNGTFVNKQRINGATRINPGDLVQFGPGGPEFMFDIEPRPAGQMKQTRLSADPNAPTAGYGSGPPPTRQGAMPPTGAPFGYGGIPPTGVPPTGVPPMGQPGGVGKATVERMIAQTKSESRKYVVIAVVALVLVVIGAGVGFFLWYQSRGAQTDQSIAGQSERLSRIEEKTAVMSPGEIAKNHAQATVFIEVAWNLFYTPTGEQLYHQYIPNNDGTGNQIIANGRQFLATYIQLDDGTIEPILALRRPGAPIGGRHTGTGFVVSDNGFILTNRHVAATWETSYEFPEDALPGLVYRFPGGRPQIVGVLNQPIRGWVPSKAKFLGGKSSVGKIAEGRIEYMDVTFAKNRIRIPAKIARVSDQHDVAMIKIDVPQSVPKVELFDNYDSVEPGMKITILGYPGISPQVGVVTQSQDPFSRESEVKVVPDPTVTDGIIGRVIRGEAKKSESDSEGYISTFGDSYQLTANATGAGNSGGPVFDDRGRVIGIFYASASRLGDARITFAVPIRYGIELMGTSAVIK
ncbi:MAG: trypsin-like peptidase domain-containing protein [Acidobacteriota bacterium]